jgi:8-oxo-dGTP pyrophosphatase MutT (NUDIX family)
MAAPLLLNIIKRLRPQRIPFRHLVQRSAVAIITRQGEHGEEILFIERATRAGDPWSGHIAFPGGKSQEDDTSIHATAIRETEEEIGLDLVKQAQLIARSQELVTRRHNALKPMVVTPYKFQLIDSHSILTPNHEVASTFWIPVDFLLNKNNHSTFRWAPLPRLRSALSLNLSCICYNKHRIWGLTYRMLMDHLDASTSDIFKSIEK